MEADVITLPEQTRKVDEANAVSLCILFIRLFVECQNRCFKPFQSLGDTAPDASEANQPYCFPVQLGDRLHRPVAGAHELPKFTQALCHGQHQGDSVISHRWSVASGGEGYNATQLLCCRHIDLVIPNASFRDDAKLRKTC